MRGRFESHWWGVAAGFPRVQLWAWSPTCRRWSAATPVRLHGHEHVLGDATVAGSLPWAVLQSDYQSPGLDYIVFKIPAGPFVIDVNQTQFFIDQVCSTAPASRDTKARR